MSTPPDPSRSSAEGSALFLPLVAGVSLVVVAVGGLANSGKVQPTILAIVPLVALPVVYAAFKWLQLRTVEVKLEAALARSRTDLVANYAQAEGPVDRRHCVDQFLRAQVVPGRPDFLVWRHSAVGRHGAERVTAVLQSWAADEEAAQRLEQSPDQLSAG